LGKNAHPRTISRMTKRYGNAQFFFSLFFPPSSSCKRSVISRAFSSRSWSASIEMHRRVIRGNDNALFRWTILNSRSITSNHVNSHSISYSQCTRISHARASRAQHLSPVFIFSSYFLAIKNRRKKKKKEKTKAKERPIRRGKEEGEGYRRRFSHNNSARGPSRAQGTERGAPIFFTSIPYTSHRLSSACRVALHGGFKLDEQLTGKERLYPLLLSHFDLICSGEIY